MKASKPVLSLAGFTIFLLALLLGVLVTLAKAVPDLESTQYGFVKYDYPAVPSLKCPMLMTSADQNLVTIRLHNTLDRPLKWFIQSELSSAVVIQTDEQTVVLQPGESRIIAWEVNKANVDLSDFIFASVFTSAATAQGMNQSTCGTLVLALPFRGGAEIYIASLALVVVGLIGGFWLWMRHSDRSEPGVNAQIGWMIFTSIVLLIALVLSILSSYFFAILLVLIIVMGTVVFLIPRLFRSSQDISMGL